MNLFDQLARKQIQLRENLESRKFSHVGIKSFHHFQEVERGINDGSIDPKVYWEFETPVLLEELPNLSGEARRHWQASLAQVVYFRCQLNEYQNERKMIANEAKRVLHHNQALISLSETLGWGFYHWALAEDYYGRRQRAYAERGSKGGVARSIKRQEEDALLSCLVKAQLEHHPQRKNGWPDAWYASSLIAEAIQSIAKQQNLPVRQEGDDLLDTIFILLDEPGSVRDLYLKLTKRR